MVESAHRLHERADPRLLGGSQLLQREGGRPHGAFVEDNADQGVSGESAQDGEREPDSGSVVTLVS